MGLTRDQILRTTKLAPVPLKLLGAGVVSPSVFLIRCLESLAICGFRVHCGLRQSKAKKAAVVSALRLWTAETLSPARSWMLNIKPHPRTAGKEKVCSMRGFQTFRLRCSQLLYAPTSSGCRNSGCSRMVLSGNSRTVYGLGVLLAK